MSTPVRVRMAPSPTGSPHVGLVRTALFNFAFARHAALQGQDATFVLRIEDTDKERSTEESYQAILDLFRWIGLDWDEGVEKGGPYGPYRQSERGDLYRDVLAKLAASSHTYECFCTNEEVDARRKASGSKVMGYDGFCRDLSAEQRAAFEAEGRAPLVRFRMPEGSITWDDLVRGDVTFDTTHVPDFALCRANGDPLYTLTAPVDDATMHITHVLRGEDLLSSTPRQIALYHALIDIGVASAIPRFGHLPYVTGEGNKKLSKRDPESNLFHHRDRGFIPEGLLNYLSLLGWSLTHDRDVFTMDEMVAAFDVANVNPNPARFDVKKAEAINGDHVRKLAIDDFVERSIPYCSGAGLFNDVPRPSERALLTRVAPLVQERVTLLGEVPGLVSFLFTDDADLEIESDARASLGADAAAVLDAGIAALEPLDDFTPEPIEAALRAALIDGLGLKPRLAFGPLRVAVSGRRVSPPLFESMELLGKESTLTRLRALRASL